MVNAWSLLYEELNGTMDETYPIKEDGMTGIKTDVTVLGGEDKSPYWYCLLYTSPSPRDRG